MPFSSLVPALVLPLFLGLTAVLGHPKLAPFTAVRWDGDAPEVRVDGTFFGLRSIDGEPIGEILSFAQGRYGERWRKRFTEDLVEVLSDRGTPPGRTVELALVDLETGAERTVDAAMTEENRRAAWEYANAGPPSRTSSPPPLELTADEARLDLAFLLQEMRLRHSYFRLKGIDAEAAFEEEGRRIDGPLDVPAFARTLSRLIARFGDGHARVDANPNDLFPPGYLPFLIGVSGERFVAFHDDRTRLLDPEHPYLEAIDGRPIHDWIEVGASVAAAGSPQLVRERGARNLRFLRWARAELDRPASDEVRVTLAAAKGRRTRDVTLPVADRKPVYGEWPRRESGWLDRKIGYLRVSSMVSPEDDPDFFADLRRWMAEFESARGLILDVRGNGGGSRHLLGLLLPYVLDPKSGPRVVNAARKRLEPGDDPADPRGLLGETRGLFPRGSARHDDTARAAIDRFRSSFRPKWGPPDGEFSDWHYMVVQPAAEGEPRFGGPVAVLVDEVCFSATDVFCAAFKGAPNVTLVGTATGGGSGRARPVRLPHSRLEVLLSSMASYQPDGHLFDGHGVQPDVVVQKAPTDFVGATDTVLDAAVKRLR